MSSCIVVLKGKKKGHKYDGDYEVAYGPQGQLVVNEMKVNVLAKANEPTKMPHPVSVYNSDTWTMAMIGEGNAMDTDTVDNG